MSIAIIILLYVWVFLIGLFTGRLLNTLIYNMPGSDLFRFGRKNSAYENREMYAKYLRMEFFCAVLFVIVFLQCGFGLQSVLFCVITAALVVSGANELQKKEVPVPAVLVIVICAAVFMIMAKMTYGKFFFVNRLIGIFAVSIPLLIFSFLKPGNIRPGVVFLSAAGGFLLGWKSMIAALVLALILLLIVTVCRKVSRDRACTRFSAKLLFGPCLCYGIWLAAVFSPVIIRFL